MCMSIEMLAYARAKCALHAIYAAFAACDILRSAQRDMSGSTVREKAAARHELQLRPHELPLRGMNCNCARMNCASRMNCNCVA